MKAFPDSSFLYAIYRPQTRSREAASVFASLGEALPVTSLLLFEFRQSVRLQSFLFRSDRTRGFSEAESRRLLTDLQSDLASRVLVTVSTQWAEVHEIAERLSAVHTCKDGYRAFDVLHVATALYFGAKIFLTLDGRQAALAKAEGLEVRP